MYENNYPNDYGKKNNAQKNTNTSQYGNDGYYYGGNSQNTYQAGSGYGYNTNQPPKKEKKQKTGGGFFKKALAAISLGLFFGICAGLGFFAVDRATGMLSDTAARNNGALTADYADNTQNNTVDSVTEGLVIPEGGNTASGQAVIMNVSGVVNQVMPSIVSINTTFQQTMTSFFGQEMTSEATSVGSGIIVGESDTELLVVTNYHVVEAADTLVVQFTDGTEAEAQMKGSDADMDLAVIAVSLDNVGAETKNAIAIAKLGDSDSLTVGEPAIAIGNSLGYGQSVTTGVISALDRVIGISEGGTSDASFIQTDAAINPGNSGGALLNMNGEVIGINSNKIGGSVVEGMGYAIPISAAKPIIENLMLKETRAKAAEENKGYLGISPLTVVNEMTEAYGMPKGVYVSQVYEGTAAAAAGIVKGNIITEFDGNKIASSEDLLRVMEYYSQGDTVEVTIMQGIPTGWESKSVTITLGGKFEG